MLMRHSVIDIKFQPWFGLQITDTVYNDKVKHSPLANTSEILTTCFKHSVEVDAVNATCHMACCGKTRRHP